MVDTIEPKTEEQPITLVKKPDDYDGPEGDRETFFFSDGAVLCINSDSDPLNPRKEFDNAAVMVCFHNRYDLGDKPESHGYKTQDFPGWDAMKKQIIKDHRPVVILPLYLYDHGGITMNTTGFSCHWDSGQVGFVFVSRDTALKEWGGKFGKRITKQIREKAKNCALAEVELYDKYLTGECCGFTFVDPSGEDESCWGYYSEEDCLNNLEDYINEKYAKLVRPQKS